MKFIIYWFAYVSNYDTLAISGRFIIEDKTIEYYTKEGYKTSNIKYKIQDDHGCGLYLLDDNILMRIKARKIRYNIKNEHITLKRKWKHIVLSAGHE